MFVIIVKYYSHIRLQLKKKRYLCDEKTHFFAWVFKEIVFKEKYQQAKE
jgi:hypothetical protein